MKKVLILIFLLSCSSSGEQSTNTNTQVNSDISKVSTCGVVVNKELSSEIPSGELVQVDIIDTNFANITKFSDPNSKKLIKFHGITSEGIDSYRVLHGIDLLKKHLLGGAYFVQAGEDCFENTSRAILGQLFTPDGISINELLIREGAAAASLEECSGNLLAQCYNSLEITTRPPSDAELDLQSVNIASRCGAVKESKLINPITKVELVSVQAISAEAVIVTRKSGVEAGKSQLIKLHGLTTSGLSNTANARAIEHINNNLGSSAYLLVASQKCEMSVNGGPGVAGQLYNTNGIEFNIDLISRGFALSTEDSCNGNLIYACYQNIEAGAPKISDPIPENTENSENTINGDADYIDDFLWKPISDSNGKLAVLVNPYNVKIVVTGNFTETLRDAGSGNGRGTTGRGQRPGCDYGNNIKVEFFTQENKQIPLKDGRSSVNISDGCKRVEFKLR